eukprot:CAMPEP_0113665160 /NCGR_PEP_ID=MMETSP0038_2-20120614/2147_1 /TAXON_ID=2898 /ORGANISM="Cryptomonas paramecium" /LENGTH=158 /DNA_ID=CAMNT_0000580475 /DNA_START=291 /DNA_END=767 /DNA_ORIENTATION=- /assembly_acc=CAM_ASM_000170
MKLDNEIIRRSRKVGIQRRVLANVNEFQSVDEYMMKAHMDAIIATLDSLTAFGLKVTGVVEQDQCADSWFINRHLLIHSRHWIQYSSRVLTAIKLIELTHARNFVDEDQGKSKELFTAVQRARNVFESYGMEDVATISLPTNDHATANHLSKRRRFSA